MWGPGAGGFIWEAWQRRTEERELRREGHTGSPRSSERGGRGGKGKAVVSQKSSMGADDDGEGEVGKREETEMEMGAVVVFACRHMFHRSCLEKMRGAEGGGDGRLVCPLE